MKKAISILLTSILLAPLLNANANAGTKVHLSFLMINPKTNLNVGAGTNIVLTQVSRNDRQSANTNSDGLVSFDIEPEAYFLDTYCPVCYGNNTVRSGTEYLVTPKNDGSVSIISASDNPVLKDAAGNWIISTTLTRDPIAGDPWELMPAANLGGWVHRLFLLTNGEVLCEIQDSPSTFAWWILSPDNKGEYISGTWRKISSPSPNYNPSAMNGATLHDGRMMIVGGEFNYNAQGVGEENTNQSYIYDLVKNSWTYVAPPNNGEGLWAKIGAPPFVALADGRVMLSYFGNFGQSSYNESMIYDPTTNKWTLSGLNKVGRTTEAGYTLLSNDKILTVNTDRGVTSAEIFDPATGLWAPAGNTPEALANSEIGPALMMPQGKVLAEGATGANAIFDPMTNSWSSAARFPTLKNGIQLEAPDNYSAVLSNGNIFTSTGTFICSTQNCSIMGPSPFFEYNLKTNTWIPVIDDLVAPADSVKGTDYVMLPLPNGKIMVTINGRIEFYSASGSPEQSWLPVIDSLSSTTLSPGTTYQVTGKQLSGLSQGTHFGDEYVNATNFPIVRIENNETHHISFARSFDFSSTSIQPMVSSTLNFEIGTKIENGPSSIQIIASGFASKPFDVTISGGVSANKPTPVEATKSTVPTASPTPTTSQNAIATTIPSSLVPQHQGKSQIITCKKGKITQKIKSISGKCPAGYQKK